MISVNLLFILLMLWCAIVSGIFADFGLLGRTRLVLLLFCFLVCLCFLGVLCLVG